MLPFVPAVVAFAVVVGVVAAAFEAAVDVVDVVVVAAAGVAVVGWHQTTDVEFLFPLTLVHSLAHFVCRQAFRSSGTHPPVRFVWPWRLC